MNTEQIARVAHEANRAYCTAIGDPSQVAWDDAPDWQRESAIKGVQAERDGSAKTPEEQHQSWLDEKARTGWTYGPVKDAEAKTHPCFVPYHELPAEQQRKDELFRAVVVALDHP